MVELSPLRQLRMGQLPKMVSWYDPRLLARIGVRTIISSVFGQYADQRLIQAVTDPCDDKDLCDPLRLQRSQCRRSEPAHRRRRERRLLDRLRCRRRRRLRVHLHDRLPARPGRPRRPPGGPAAARRGPHHGRRPVLSAGHARGIQEEAADAVQLGVHGARIRTASCSRFPATTTGTTASTPSTACSALRATGTPRATRSAAGSASSTAATGPSSFRTTGGSGAPTSSSRSTSTSAR